MGPLLVERTVTDPRPIIVEMIR
jgi:hypothetical protein